ncbi:MAG: hypothetical protein CHACPFDD_03828 [Phycisphaerae bacterium]|nr:hypothetical protein [Phycisphaerae bacterium]
MEECCCCHAPARVAVLRGYDGGQPDIVRYCIHCADQRTDENAGPSAPRDIGLKLRILSVAAGALLGALGIAADQLRGRDLDHVGWLQILGLCGGALLASIGALLRVDVVALGGAALFALSGLADVLGLSLSAGIGWKQWSAVVIGAALVLAGVGPTLVRRRGMADSTLRGA